MQLDVRLVIVDNGSTDAATLEYLDRCGNLVVRAPGAFNFSRLVNRGVAAAGPVDHILLFNNDVVRGRPGWLGALVEHSQRAGVGAVGARLLYEDGTPQHEGIWVGTPNVPAENLDLSSYFGMGLVARNVSAVTGACLMVKRVLWEELDGFDEFTAGGAQRRGLLPAPAARRLSQCLHAFRGAHASRVGDAWSPSPG